MGLPACESSRLDLSGQQIHERLTRGPEDVMERAKGGTDAGTCSRLDYLSTVSCATPPTGDPCRISRIPREPWVPVI